MRDDPDEEIESKVEVAIWPIGACTEPFRIQVDRDATMGQFESLLKSLTNMKNCMLTTVSGKPVSFNISDSYQRIMCCHPLRDMVYRKEKINLQLVRIASQSTYADITR